MTYQIGDPLHLIVHNDIVARLEAFARRGRITVTLPNPAALGDSGHVTDHNLILAAIEAIQAAPPGMEWAEVSGGTASDAVVEGVPHTLRTFTSGGTLTVTKAGYARVAVVGGGGGSYFRSSDSFSAAGGGGQVIHGIMWLPIGTHTVTIGGGGNRSSADGATIGSTGGTTSIGTIARAFGGGAAIGHTLTPAGPGGATTNGGAGAGAGGPASGATPGPGVTVSTVTGDTVEYGRGGTNGDPQATPANTGRGGVWKGDGAGSNGGAGVAFVSIEK